MTDAWWKIYELGRRKVIQTARISPSAAEADISDAGICVVTSDQPEDEKQCRLRMVAAWLGDLREFQRERLRMN